MKQQSGAARLEAARRMKRWSCGDLADELAEHGCDVRREYLWRVETGAQDLTRLDVAVALEQVLAIPVESWPRFEALTRLLELRSRAA